MDSAVRVTVSGRSPDKYSRELWPDDPPSQPWDRFAAVAWGGGFPGKPFASDGFAGGEHHAAEQERAPASAAADGRMAEAVQQIFHPGGCVQRGVGCVHGVMPPVVRSGWRGFGAAHGRIRHSVRSRSPP
jgi:hypothetical protein